MKLKLLRFLSAAILATAATAAFGDPIDVPVPGSDPNSEPCTPKERTDDYHKNHFSEDIEKSQGGDFDAVMFGDSITDFWNSNPNLSLDGDPVDTRTFNMGIGSDRVQNLLWRLRNGALEGYTTKYMTLMVGINNGHQKCIDHNDHADRPEDVAESIRLMLKTMSAKQPDAKILLMPIIPYSFDSKYFEAAEVTAMSEAVNNYILQFVDNKRVFWVDLRGKYLNRDSTPNKDCYRVGEHGGYDAVGLCLHPEFATYSGFWRPALTNAMHKYLSVPAGQPHVAEPSIGYAKAAPNADGAGSATITVHGIFLGTDADANPVATYSIDYQLDGGSKTRALSGQTSVRNSFVIPNVSLGQHTCKVTVTTADAKELVTLLDFTMTDPWYASPLPVDDSAVRTDGTLAYAYATGAYTVKGVPFAAAGNNNANISGDIAWPYNQTSGSPAPDGVASGAYRDLLTHCWWANQGDKEVTLKNLTAGRSYLVQIFGYRNYNNDGKAHVWIKESYWDPNYIKVFGDGWTRGGVLTGTFTATAATKTFTIKSDGNYGINGIQVRDLGESGVPTVVQPSVGALSVTTNGTAATVFLSGIVMGTDDAGTNATSYSVSYKLNGGALTTALTAQTAATASFVLADLADGDYACAVSITTDKGKTSAEKSVSFRIGPPPPPVIAPSIGEISVATNGTTATVALSGVAMGTDDGGVAASSYSIAYSLGGAAPVAVSGTFSSETVSFDIEDLADGKYTCVATITTDKGKTASKSVSFRIGELPPVPTGWTAEPMDAAGAKFSTQGELVYAYATQAQSVNGIPFTRALPLDSTHKIAFAPAATGFDGSLMNEGVADSAYGLVLGNGWVWSDSSTNEKTVTLTLKNLTPGDSYLVQILSHTHWSKSMVVSVNGSDPQHVHADDETGGKYGALMTGYFTASAATEDVEIVFSGSNADRPVNAVQVRDLGAGGGVVVIPPSIGSVAAATSGSNATITISGVVMGTDDLGTNATSYAVSYALDGAAAVTALQGQTGSTASFDLEGLANGSHTCEVTITTDKGKTSAAKSVSFAISTGGGGGGGGGSVEAGWTAAALGATSASIRTDGTLVYAYARNNYTVNGVAFAGEGDDGIDNANCTVNVTHAAGNSPPADTEAGDYKNLLGAGWYAYPGDRTVTLRNLETGKKYLVQIIASRSDFTTQTATAPDGEHTIRFGGTDWEYGGSLTGVFTAESATQQFTIVYAGNSWLNGIQVRELPAGGGGFEDWPADPDTEITDATRPSDLSITNGAFAASSTTTAELRRLAKWAKANGVPFAGPDVNAMAFDEAGNPDNAFSTAYLLNCAVDGIDEAKAAFRFAAFVPGTVPSIEGGYNGTVTVQGADSLASPWASPATADHRFFRAVLTR